MTDKQIIIDEMIEEIGFDVQQCGYLEIIEDAPNYPEIGGTYTAFECNLYCRDCKFIDDCRYKQLLRKEQECDELKKQLEPLQDKYFQGLDTIAIAGIAKLILQKISEVEDG